MVYSCYAEMMAPNFLKRECTAPIIAAILKKEGLQ